VAITKARMLKNRLQALRKDMVHRKPDTIPRDCSETPSGLRSSFHPPLHPANLPSTPCDVSFSGRSVSIIWDSSQVGEVEVDGWDEDDNDLRLVTPEKPVSAGIPPSKPAVVEPDPALRPICAVGKASALVRSNLENVDAGIKDSFYREEVSKRAEGWKAGRLESWSEATATYCL